MSGGRATLEAQGAADPCLHTSLYLGNIPEGVDEAFLASFLDSQGLHVTNKEFKIQVSPMSTMRERFTVLSFATQEDCASALALLSASDFTSEDSTVRKFFVSPYVSNFKSRRLSGDGSIVVKGLPLDISEDSLKDLFSRYGTILSARLTDGRTSSGRTAFVNFSTDQAAQLAIREANGQRLGASVVTVERMLSPEERRRRDFRVYLTDVPAEYANRAKLIEVLTRHVGPGCIVTDNPQCPITCRARWNPAKGVQSISAMFNCTSSEAMDDLIAKVNVHEILGMHAQRWVEFREASRRRTPPGQPASAVPYTPGARPPVPALAVDGLRDDVDADLLFFCRTFGTLEALGVAEGRGCKVGYVQYRDMDAVNRFKHLAVAQERIFGKRLAKDEQAGITIGYANLQ